MSARKRLPRIVLADASPLISLAAVGGLEWLHGLFGTVTLTTVVRDEIIPGAGRAGESEIGAAIERKRLRVIDDEWSIPQFPELDEGEASMLRAAVNLRVPCLLLIDERAGRAVARELGFAVTGTVGIIVAARRRALIPAVRPVFEQLLDRNFRISAELIRAALSECGEG